MSVKKDAQILVVGAGPIGSFLALCLAQYGISVSIIDKISSRTTFTKALTINSSVLKVFQGVGISDDFLKKGKILTDAVGYYNGHLAIRLNKKYLDTCHNYFLSIPQTITEEILHDKLKDLGIFIEYNRELIDLHQEDKFVEAKIKHTNSGEVATRRYEFIIGCDGAHSKTRELVGLPFEGKDYDMYFVVADVFFEDNCRIEKSSYFMNEQGDFVGTFLMRDDGCTRLAIKQNGLLPREKPIFDKEFLQTCLDTVMINKPLKIKKMTWSSAAQIITRTTRTGKVGRIFIAGDAYHLFSPVGGHNMNTGFHDAMNLAWKLAFYLKGFLQENILDSYSSEREIAIKKILEVTDLNTQIVMQRDLTHPKRKLFQPKLSNRKYFRTELPYEFAGYFADYSTGESLIGKHVPYIDGLRSLLGVESTYDLPQFKKYVIFLLASAHKKITFNHKFVNKDIFLTVEIDPFLNPKVVDTLHLNNDNICFVRPDGFIGYWGTIDKLLSKEFYL